MLEQQILDTIRQDATAFGMCPLDYLPDQAAASEADGDMETYAQALRHAAHFLREEG